MPACLNSWAGWRRLLIARLFMPVSAHSSKDLKNLQRGQEENHWKYAEVTSLSWLFRFDVQAGTSESFTELSRHYLLVPDLSPGQASFFTKIGWERCGWEKTGKRKETLSLFTHFLTLSGFPVGCCLISKRRSGAVDFTALWAGCQAKSLDNCPINERLFSFGHRMYK